VHSSILIVFTALLCSSWFSVFVVFCYLCIALFALFLVRGLSLCRFLILVCLECCNLVFELIKILILPKKNCDYRVSPMSREVSSHRKFGKIFIYLHI
jgi:hypothetical protein